MTLLLSQVSESVAVLVANAAPLMAAIRVGQNRHVSGFLWRNDLLVTSDQALPAAASFTVVLSNGALVSAWADARDPANNLAMLRLDGPVAAALAEPARSATIGALVLALGADFDGSPTVRLTAIHAFPRTPSAGSAMATITLDLAGDRVNQGGMALDADGRLLGMTGVSAAGDAIVVPHGVIGRFLDSALAEGAPEPCIAAAAPRTMADPVAAARDETAARTGNGAPKGWLGVSLQPITVPEVLAQRAGQRTARQVVSITRGGPADRAGLRAGDVLLALDGASTTGNHALRAFLTSERIGSQVVVRLMRDGLVHTTMLTIAAQPEP
jgi:S1-C subfamily serine protease